MTKLIARKYEAWRFKSQMINQTIYVDNSLTTNRKNSVWQLSCPSKVVANYRQLPALVWDILGGCKVKWTLSDSLK